ncbi:MAG: SBBP repeat-containing protein, partial [Candidatus Marinimicrobia bacterium]|nr:SBBP repeat-containing protein [Candidatus Neomarinimicrobiota bacterium]
MRLKLITSSSFILFILLLSSGAGRTRIASPETDLFQEHANPKLGKMIEMGPQALLNDYRHAKDRPGLGMDYSVTPSWEFADVLTDSVDFGWAQEFGSQTMPSTDKLTGLTVDPTGNVYVTGYSDFVWLTMKYDASGTLLWSQTYAEPGITDTYGEDILVDAAGNVFVSGYRWGPFIDSDILLIKYDPSGVEQWVADYAGAGLNNDFPNAMALDSAGNVFIGGYSYSATVDADFMTLKFDSEGNLLWDRLFNGSAWSDDWITDIALDDSANVYVAGVTADDENNDDFGIIKYSADGTTVWITQFDGITGTDWANSIAVDAAGKTYVTGVSQHYDDYIDYYTLKLDSAGEEIWGIRWGVSGTGAGDSWASDIVVDDSL